MHTIIKRVSASLAILFVAMNEPAVAQNVGRGGLGPDPATLAAAKAQTESATSQMHAYLNEIDDVPNSVESRDGDRDGFSCYPALARSTRSLSLQGSSRAAFSIQRC